MPPQDASINRNRGWSSETFSDGGRRLLEPERQPVNAPGSPGGCIQASEGFVRFLRTHSPPTHQRVTAGGRIVPVEPLSAPPQFKLPTNNLIRNTIAPAAQNIGHNSVRREQHSETSSSTMYNELGYGSHKHYKPDANFPINRGTPMLPEPFPKFYDDQTGQEDVQKAATDKGKAIVNGNIGTESKTNQPDCQVSGIVQSTAHSIS